jgi:hypothetical protein
MLISLIPPKIPTIDIYRVTWTSKTAHNFHLAMGDRTPGTVMARQKSAGKA